MGEVGYLTALYDDPGLIHAFNEFFLGFAQNICRLSLMPWISTVCSCWRISLTGTAP